MEKRFIHPGFIFSILILILFTGNSLHSASDTPYDIPNHSQANAILAKNGQQFGYLQTSILSYTFQWSFIFTINRGLGRDVRNSNFKRWLKNITTLPEIPDGDHWITNYIGHPLLGASVYAFYKN
ncbi:MAG: hypothetical protein ACE5HI_14940, partial [bacterium]